MANSVIELLAKGDFYFGNPSSVHKEGKKAKKVIRSVKDFLYDLFSLSPDKFDLIFHSGATEGINNIIKGYFLHYFQEKKMGHFFYALTDHSSVRNTVDVIKTLGHTTHHLKVNKNGDFDEEDLKQKILQIRKNDSTVPILINYTFVNNENGVVWPLFKIKKIKEEFGVDVHVDAAQSIGKIDLWWKLDDLLDAYTYSGHKFGALKGIGFSFISTKLPLTPLISGGGQQGGKRSGTENVLGIQSLQLSLEELKGSFDFERLNYAKMYFEEELAKRFGDKIEIISKNAQNRNGNTTFLVVKNQKSDVVQAAFDIEGIQVGTGSACSSETTLTSAVLMAQGYLESDAQSAIRFSFPFNFSTEDVKECLEKITVILERLVLSS